MGGLNSSNDSGLVFEKEIWILKLKPSGDNLLPSAGKGVLGDVSPSMRDAKIDSI